jgi:hypothetical protein
MSVPHRFAEQSAPKDPRAACATLPRQSRHRLHLVNGSSHPMSTRVDSRNRPPCRTRGEANLTSTITTVMAVMASEDANDRSNPATLHDRVRICGECGADMKQLGKLPAIARHPAIRVFRCYGCDNVVSEQM